MAYEITGVVVTFALIFVAAWFLGGYMAKVFQGQRTFLSFAIRPVERLWYKVTGIKEEKEQTWVQYLAATLLVTVLSLLVTFLILRFQDKMPFQAQLNPQNFPGLTPDLAFNTAVSFTTNTNWQNYGGEITMSYFSQMAALVFHQFLSAATGIALAVALVRGLVRRSGKTVGNFYVDITRCTLYILLPIAVIATLVLVSQGAIQNLNNYVTVHTVEGATQLLPMGPVGSMEAIKDLGTNGGGFFNANSAHPWENPNGFTNAFEVFLMLLIPFALAIMFGRMVGRIKQGLSIFAAMALVLTAGVVIATVAEQTGNPTMTTIGVTQASTDQQSGGNMEGKEVRFGAIQSAMLAASTAGTSTGTVDSAHDSYTPIGGMVPLVLIELGEITPGGVGSGLYGMLIFAILAVFIAGLMVGRTPEYLGKKIEAREIKLAALAILALPASILGLTAISVLVPAGHVVVAGVTTAGPSNPGPHGFSEILYAFSSVTGNNGSAFAGLVGNTVYYNTMLALGMWIGRIIFFIPVLALAGSLVKKKVVPQSAGTFPTDTPLFTGLLIGVIIIVGALTFFPALALGPILEHLQFVSGHVPH